MIIFSTVSIIKASETTSRDPETTHDNDSKKMLNREEMTRDQTKISANTTNLNTQSLYR